MKIKKSHHKKIPRRPHHKKILKVVAPIKEPVLFVPKDFPKIEEPILIIPKDYPIEKDMNWVEKAWKWIID